MTTTCSFVGAELPRTVNQAIPTFYIDPSNTNYLQDTGSFLDQHSSICSFPTMYGLLFKNTLTPYVVDPSQSTTMCSNGGLIPGIALATNGVETYNQYACPTITYNQMATGTWTVGFTEASGPAFTPQSFVIAGPPTTVTDIVYATISATATSTAGPSTTTMLVSTMSAGAVSTNTVEDYSATFVSTIYVTLDSKTKTVYIRPDTSTTTLSAQPSITTTLTQYLDAYSTSSTITPILSSMSLSTSSSFITSIISSASSASSTALSFSSNLLTSIITSATGVSSSSAPSSPRTMSTSAVSLSSSSNFLASSTAVASSSLSYSTSLDTSGAPKLSTSYSYSSIPLGSSGVSIAMTDSSSSHVTSLSSSTVPTSLRSSSSVHSSSSATIVATPLATFSCPTSDRTTFTASSGQLFQAVCYEDFQPQQIGVKYVQSFSSCIQACDSTSGCLSVSWLGSSGAGYCYLKGQNTISVTSTSVWGAIAISNQTQYTCPDSNGESYSAPGGTIYTIECYLDRVANSMASSFQSTFEKCVASCEATTGCVDVSWLPSGQCYLKSTIMPAASNIGVWGATKGTPSPTTSATKTTAIVTATICPNGYASGAPMACPAADGICYQTSSNDTFQVACYSDAMGGDLGSSWNPSFESCLDTCSNTTGCIDVSFEYRGTGNRICYMKSSISTPISNSAVYGASRVATRSSSSTTTGLIKRTSATLPGPDYTYPNLPKTYITSTSVVIAATRTLPASTVVTTTQYTAATPTGVTSTTRYDVLSSTTTITLPASTYTVTNGISSTVVVTITPSPSGVSTVTVTQGGSGITTLYAATTSTSANV